MADAVVSATTQPGRPDTKMAPILPLALNRQRRGRRVILPPTRSGADRAWKRRGDGQVRVDRSDAIDLPRRRRCQSNWTLRLSQVWRAMSRNQSTHSCPQFPARTTALTSRQYRIRSDLHQRGPAQSPHRWRAARHVDANRMTLSPTIMPTTPWGLFPRNIRQQQRTGTYRQRRRSAAYRRPYAVCAGGAADQWRRYALRTPPMFRAPLARNDPTRGHAACSTSIDRKWHVMRAKTAGSERERDDESGTPGRMAPANPRETPQHWSIASGLLTKQRADCAFPECVRWRRASTNLLPAGPEQSPVIAANEGQYKTYYGRGRFSGDVFLERPPALPRRRTSGRCRRADGARTVFMPRMRRAALPDRSQRRND